MTKREQVREKMFYKMRHFEQSGLSKSDFCRKHRLRQGKFHYWLKIYHTDNIIQEDLPAFLPVTVDELITSRSHERIVVSGHGGLQVSFPAHAASIPLIRQLLEG